MLTWLDQYIRDIGHTHRADWVEVEGKRKNNPHAHLYKGLTDMEVCREVLRDILANLKLVYNVAYAQEAKGGPDYMRAGLMQAEAVSAFIFPEKQRLLALQVEPSLLDDFLGAKAPETADYEAILSEYDCIYIDLPAGQLPFGGVYLRAIIIHKSHLNDKIRVFCAMPVEGQKVHLDNQIELGWNMGEFPDEEISIGVNHVDTGTRSETGYSASDIYMEVEELLRLALLYHASGASPTVFLPHVDPERLTKLSNLKKAAAKQKQASLFKVRKLSSPSDRFGREASERVAKGSYKLGVRTHVRGHFRWQAHGPKHSLRRLQWIGAFERGPKDGHDRPELHVLR